MTLRLLFVVIRAYHNRRNGMADTQWDLINLLTPTSKEDPDAPCYDPAYPVYAIDNFGDNAEGSRWHRAITCGISTLLSMAEAIFGKNGRSWGTRH